jgi:hypothetical protein
VGICLESIKEGCCDNLLNDFTIIPADVLDTHNSTCDKVIECSNRYILVEEKSIVIGFLHECCNELGANFDSYKYGVNDEYLKIEDVLQLVHNLSREKKEVLLSTKIVNLLSSSLEKVSNTTAILCNESEYDTGKTRGMSTFYLYCKTGTPIDRIMYNWLSRYKKNVFIECQDLKYKLEQECL